MVNTSSMLPDFTGKSIDNGRLKLLEVIGTGAYGVVYKAIESTSTGRNQRYAVKCLLKDLPPKQRKFQAREISLHKFASQHPNVLTMHGTCEEPHYIYIILDLCPGGDLFGAITERHLYYRNDALLKEAFVQLLDAVQWCHERGIFHRDLKPENILCSEDGSRLYLSDFGLATRDNVSRDFGCGSSYYMSPECIGKEYDLGAYSTRHSDIWSLGIILTNMITGRNPWRWATTDDECFCAYLHNRDFLLDMLPISKGTNRVLRRIFTLNPHSRITIAELREAIVKMDSFWMSKAEMARASEHVKVADQSYAAKVPTAELEKLRAIHDDDSTLAGSSESSSLPSEREDTFHSGSLAQRHTVSSPPRAFVGRVATKHAVQVQPFIISSSSGSSDPDESSSSADSVGPITPETYANDPAVEVPDMPDDAGMGKLVVEPKMREEEAREVVKRPQVKSPVTSPSHLIKSAVQRFRALHVHA